MDANANGIEIPEALDELSEDELASLAENLATTASAMGEDAAGDDDSVTELERLAGEYERITGELDGRAAAAAERNERATAALSRFAKAPADDEAAETAPDDEAAEGEAPAKPFPPKKAAADVEAPVELAVEEAPEAIVEAAPEVVAEAPAAEAVELAADDSAEFMAPSVPADEASHADTSPDQSGTDSAPHGAVPSVKVNAEKMVLADEAPVELATETETVELTVEDSTEAPASDTPAEIAELAIEAPTADEADTKEMTVAEDAPVAVPTTEVLNAVVETAPSAPATVPAKPAAFSAAPEARPFETLKAGDGTEIDVKELSKRIADARNRMNNLPSGVFEYVTLATGEHTYDEARSVSTDPESNFAKFAAIRDEAQALVASGGTCAPLTPSYDIFRLAEPQSPVENALPSVGATRGGIRYIVPPAFTQASAGVRVTTNAQDIAGYTSQTPAGTTTPKPCVSVVCPGVNDVFVDAVSQCVQFGNLNYRVFPEQVESFMQDLAVVFAQTKEVKYLDAIDAASTSVNVTPDYGATRALTFALSQLVWAYRKRNHMATNATLDVYLPDSVLPMLKADMVNDWALGLNFLDASIDDVKRMVFTKLNINAVFYYDSATGDLPNMQQAQAAGSAVPFLASIRAYIFAPGTFVRLDGGTLDVGIVRDSALNGTNNLQIFAEEWVQVAKVGLESIRANITLCPSGTGPAAKTALICAS